MLDLDPDRYKTNTDPKPWEQVDILELESMDIRDSSKRERKEKRRLKEEKLREQTAGKKSKSKKPPLTDSDSDSGKWADDNLF